ncbi:MAG: ATP-dependent DNA helicase PcrA, partial [Acidobacteria bacterium]
MNYLDELNERQREAVMNVEGPLLVLAGAGSGKTRVITYRVAYLIDRVGIEPRRILAVTFTNKAADEMRDRVIQLLDGRSLPELPLICTFHSFCVRLLRAHIESHPSGYTRHFSIYDDEDSLRAIKAAMTELQLNERLLSPRAVQAVISQAKNRGLSAAEYGARARRAADAQKEAIGRIFQWYERHLRTTNALDFDDLLLKAVELLRSRSSIREHYNERFRYLLIDEYQDTNHPQFELARLLTERHQNLCVVGDPDQSIYRFRGADIHNIIDFKTHFPQAKVITLEQNYRSTQRILTVANSLIGHNTQRPKKSLRTENEPGDPVAIYEADTGEEEARFVAETIKNLLGHSGSPPSTMRVAVLYRT